MFGKPFHIHTKHPGMAEGEVYIGDVTENDFQHAVKWKTKRAVPALHKDGIPLPSCWYSVAVFVQIKELEADDFKVNPDGSITNTRDLSAPFFEPVMAPIRERLTRRALSQRFVTKES